MSTKKEITEAEIERFERIRLFEIEKLKRDIDNLKTELRQESSKFLKSSKKISNLKEDIKAKEDQLLKLEHQTGYDLLVDSQRNGFSQMLSNIDAKKIGSAVELVGKVIPIPVVNSNIKKTGKNIKKL